MPIELIQISTQNLNEVVKTEQQGNITINGYDADTDSLKTNSLGNELENMRDEFSDLSFLNQNWQINKDPFDVIDMMGNADGSAYLSIIKNYRIPETKTEIISNKSFSLPSKINVGVTSSTRLNGTDFDIDFVSVDANKNIETSVEIVELFVESMTISSNIWTVTCFEDIIGKLFTSDIVLFHSMDNTDLCLGPVIITLNGRKSFTFTLLATNATFTTAEGQIGSLGMVRRLDNLNRSVNGVGFSLEGISQNSVRISSRNKNASYTESRTDSPLTNFSVATTNFTNKPYTFGWKQQRIMEMNINSKSITWNAFTDGLANPILVDFTFKKHMPLPDFNKKYVLRFSVDTFKNLSLIYKADIESITRPNGSTTVTVVTKKPHNLKVGNRIITGGTTNSVNFPLLTTSVAVRAVIDDNTFTYIQTIPNTIAASGTDGSVFIINGTNNNLPILNLTFSNYEVSNNILTVISTTNTTMNVGFHYQFFSTGSDEVDNTIWRCVESNLTITKLEPINGSVANVVLRTRNFLSVLSFECRIHLAQIQSYKRNIVEISNTWGNRRDIDEAMGVNIVSPIANVSTVATVSAVTRISNPVSINSFLQSSVSTNVFAYQSQISENTGVSTFYTNLNSINGIQRNKLNAVVFSDIPIIAQIEYSIDNIIWFSNENPVIATSIIYPFYNYSGVVNINPFTVTMNIGTPGLVNHNNHLLRDGAPIIFSTTGILSTGILKDTVYYIRVINSNSYHLYDTFDNAIQRSSIVGRINFSGSQSGTHSVSNLKRLTTANGASLLLGTNINITDSISGQVYSTASTEILIGVNSMTMPSTGNITVPNNSIFRASIIESVLVGSHFRLRLVNPTSQSTKIIYATMNQLTS